MSGGGFLKGVLHFCHNCWNIATSTTMTINLSIATSTMTSGKSTRVHSCTHIATIAISTATTPTNIAALVIVTMACSCCDPALLLLLLPTPSKASSSHIVAYQHTYFPSDLSSRLSHLVIAYARHCYNK